MQTAAPRIWTLVTMFIFYDNNHYITNTSRIYAGNIPQILKFPQS